MHVHIYKTRVVGAGSLLASSIRQEGAKVTLNLYETSRLY